MPFMLNPTEDAHEYMMELKKSLHLELNPVPEQGNETALTSQNQDVGNITIYTAMDDFWRLFNSGITRQTVTCQACENVRDHDDPFNKIILKFPDNHHTKRKRGVLTISLDGLLEDISGPKSVCQIRTDACNCSNTCTAAMKREDIISFPRVLMIVLVRKRKDGGRINTKVDFPLEKHFFPNGAPYHLIGTVNHMPTNGNTDGGHYTAITKSDTADHWHQYNDDKVIRIEYVTNKWNPKVYAIYQKLAYVLCYQQSGIEHNPSHNL
jgi:ubiquitin C-terminal hydrolase